MPDRPTCTATTKTGRPCRSHAMPGRTTCKSHSGDPDVGQPSKLTPQTAAIIVRALQSGCYRETAAQHAGIGISTFYRWLEVGEADYEANIDSPHRELWDAIKKAEADAEVAAVALIRRAAGETWQAAAWLLERKNPGRWGRRERHEHTGANGGPITVTDLSWLRVPAE